jgi:hypothetical protein
MLIGGGGGGSQRQSVPYKNRWDITKQEQDSTNVLICYSFPIVLKNED